MRPSSLNKAARSDEGLFERLGSFWGSKISPILNHPANRGRSGPGQYYDIASAGINEGNWQAAASRISAQQDPMAYMETPDGAKDARLVHQALNNPVGMYEAKADALRKRHAYKLQYIDNWKKNNQGKQLSDEALAAHMAEYDSSTLDLDATKQTFNALVDYAEQQPLDYEARFNDSVRSLNNLRKSHAYISANSKNLADSLLNDEGYAHLSNMHAFVNDKNKMSLLKKISPESHEQLQNKRRALTFGYNNHAALKSLKALSTNPLMWLIRTLLLGGSSDLAALRGIHSAVTDTKSDWHKYVSPMISKDNRRYMPWLRLVHNVRGTLTGNKNFKPIIYRKQVQHGNEDA